MTNYDVPTLLENLGIHYKKAGQENVCIKCINPEHVETNPSMYIHVRTGAIHCFGCGFHGNIYTLLDSVGIHGIEAFVLVHKHKYNTITPDSEDMATKIVRARKRTLVEPTMTSDLELPPHRLAHNNLYLQRRGVTYEDVNRWHISVVTQGRYTNWILIPIYQDGILQNYFMRSVYGSSKRYAPVSRSHLLAGLDLYPDIDKKLYITEGIFDAIIFSHTKNQCVACLSNRLMPEQLKTLKRYKHIVLVPDNDTAGLELLKSALPLLHTSHVSVCFLPKTHKDAAECSLEELLESTYHEKPLLESIV